MAVLAQDDPVRTLLVDRFVDSATRHRGPAPGDPHRAVPQLEVVRVERLRNPRLQEKYLAEVQDIAGLCNRKVQPLVPLPSGSAMRRRQTEEKKEQENLCGGGHT